MAVKTHERSLTKNHYVLPNASVRREEAGISNERMKRSGMYEDGLIDDFMLS